MLFRSQLADIAYDEAGAAALRGALKAALRMRHNYIGTEHLLLGVLLGRGPAAQAFASLGLETERVEEAVTTVLQRIVAARPEEPDGSGSGPASGSGR